MKKDILKSVIALGFIFIALFSSSYLYSIKEEGKDKKEKEQLEKLNDNYSGNLVNNGFNLPVIIINTKGKQINNEKVINSKIEIYDNKEKDYNYLTDTKVLESNATIKIRGNTTRYYPKKQYSLELINKNGEKNKESLLGMAKESEWVLNAPFADKSLMRNYIAYNVSNEIMEYAPDVKFCEVFVIDDGKNTLEKKHYKGVYVLIEKIKRSEDRVNIVKTQDNISETSFIISKDKNRESDISIDSYGNETYIYDYKININYPKKDLTKEKYNYISKHISEFERILYSDKFNDPINGYEKYIDVDSFVDYYIINEFFKNLDSGLLSTYFYKDYNEKIKAGPVWDFNRSMGNHNIGIEDTYEYTRFFMIERSWFDRLMEDIRFSSKVVNRYKELRKTYLSDEYILNLIDETKVNLGEAVNRNFAIWPMDICNQASSMEKYGDLIKIYDNDINKYREFFKTKPNLMEDTTGKANSYEEEIKLMKNFITKRGQWMDENIDSLKKWSS